MMKTNNVWKEFYHPRKKKRKIDIRGIGAIEKR
jgi:hypothetical protein